MSELTRPYRAGLLEDLQDPTEALEYLNAALEDGSREALLTALHNVAEARGLFAGAGASHGKLGFHSS